MAVLRTADKCIDDVRDARVEIKGKRVLRTPTNYSYRGEGSDSRYTPKLSQNSGAAHPHLAGGFEKQNCKDQSLHSWSALVAELRTASG